MDHAFGQIDADRFAAVADEFRSREEHGTSARCDVEHALTGLDAYQRDETPAEVSERSEGIEALDTTVEDSVACAFRVSALSLIIERPPPQWPKASLAL